MFNFQWRNNPIGNIKGADVQAPMLQTLSLWEGDVIHDHSMPAVGAGYLIGLASPLDLSNNGIQAWHTLISESNACTDLAKIEPITTIDSSIIIPVINKFFHLNDNIEGVYKWQINLKSST